MTRINEFVNVTDEPLGRNLDKPEHIYLYQGTPDKPKGSLTYHCPCGCGEFCQIPVILNGPKVNPRWQVTVDGQNRITLYPSVNHLDGCKSHYFITENKVVWC